MVKCRRCTKQNRESKKILILTILGYCYEHLNLNIFFSIAIFVSFGNGGLQFKIFFEITLSSILILKFMVKRHLRNDVLLCAIK